MSLSNKEALALLRIGLEEETDLSAPVLASRTAMTPRPSGEAVSEARESTKQSGIRAADYDKASAASLSITDSRGAQFILP